MSTRCCKGNRCIPVYTVSLDMKIMSGNLDGR